MYSISRQYIINKYNIDNKFINLFISISSMCFIELFITPIHVKGLQCNKSFIYHYNNRLKTIIPPMVIGSWINEILQNKN